MTHYYIFVIPHLCCTSPSKNKHIKSKLFKLHELETRAETSKIKMATTPHLKRHTTYDWVEDRTPGRAMAQQLTKAKAQATQHYVALAVQTFPSLHRAGSHYHYHLIVELQPTPAAAASCECSVKYKSRKIKSLLS